MGNQSLSRATQALATELESLTSQPSGARACHESSNCEKPGIDLAAMVRAGPAATRLTRTWCGPSSRARYRVVDSRAALATPIQSYTGQATVASKSRPTTDPPPAALSSGRQASARAFSEYAEISRAAPTSDHPALRMSPPRQVSGLALAMAWRTPSTRPH